MRQQKNQRGFTILELMIASMVFSVILLIVTAGLLQVGRTYYRGVTQSRTQSVARAVMDDVSSRLQFSGNNFTPAVPSDYCIGNTHYHVVIGRELSDTPTGTQTPQALIAFRKLGGGCTTSDSVPSPCKTNADPNQNCQELLSTGMRLSQFSVTKPSAQPLYHIVITIASGPDDVFSDPPPQPPGVPVYTKCKGERSGAQFCAVSQLVTDVESRI